ncbi:hypothetical protein BZG36_03816 [Bifiguratus adelaidae]|uniref:Nitrate/nitrite transporter n=1 Tax=Bifiguratus adelaidae TaxID=1938954 RepID=A0A261XZN8_9FUNG|nr:hypothetical protein BZG36_03816 [Bifiguratus adelaidae]
MAISSLWKAPEINPANLKAKTFPILNPFNKYGRAFHLSWIGFFVAFLSWFAYPPLLQGTISTDLKLTPVQIANSNIVGLCVTLIVRFGVGPLCDRFGPRKVMIGCLVVGAIPTALTPFIHDYSGLLAARLFVGILGATFVPCQMWTTLFFDKNIVGRVNAFAGGWGNAGGGMTYYAMPAIVASLQRDGYSLSRAWKLSFVVGPFVIIMFVALMTWFLGEDCPEGKWSDRVIIKEQASITPLNEGSSTPDSYDSAIKTDKPEASSRADHGDPEMQAHANLMVEELEEVDQAIIEAPKWYDFFIVLCSPYTMLTALPYATTFGAELAIEGILSGLYIQTVKNSGEAWSQELAGSWGSMFGLLNLVTRPLGGYVADVLYVKTGTVVAKKYWMITCGVLEGVFLLWIGLVPSINIAGPLVANNFMAIFLEMGNGANFAVVPHINPHHTGIVAGITGAFGNLGGVMFNLAFRFAAIAGVTNFHAAYWHVGVVCIGINLLCAAILLRLK